MSLPRFLDISSSILQENTVESRFGADVNCSFPALRMRDGILMDVMFLYSGQPDAQEGPRPSGWVALQSVTGKLLLAADCAVCDFADTAAYPLDSVVALTREPSLSQKEHTQSWARLYELYEQLRLFAFEPEPADWQHEIVDEYARLFLRLAYAGHLPYYRALSPEFFGWLGLWDEPEPQPQPPEAPDASDMTAMLDRLRQGLAELAQRFEEKIETDRHKDSLFDSVHTEMQEYKNGLLGTLTEPMERDIIKVIDDIGKTIGAYRGKPPTREHYVRFFSLFEGIQTDLKDLLYRQGVEPYAVDGGAVEILRQKILATVPTADKKLDKTVAERHCEGWAKADKVIRPERVSVYVYEDPKKS